MARQNISTEDPISISSTLEKGAKAVYNAPSTAARAFGKASQKVGGAILGGSAALANILNADGSMRIKQPQQSAATFNQSLKDIGSDVASKVGSVIPSDRTIINTVGDLFKSEQRSAGGQSTGGGANNTNNAGNTGVIAPKQTQTNLGPTISPSPITPTTTSVTAPGGVFKPATITQYGGTTSFTTPSGGAGSISFKDGRTLSPEKVQRLGESLSYNASPEAKDKFAQEAEIVAQRRAEGRAFLDEALANREKAAKEAMFMNALSRETPSAQMLTLRKLGEAERERSKDLEIARLGASAKMAGELASAKAAETSSQTAERKLAFDVGKENLKVGKDIADYLIKTGQEGVELKDRLAGLRSMTGQPVSYNQFKAMHPQGDINTALSSRENLSDFLVSQGYPDEDYARIMQESGL